MNTKYGFTDETIRVEGKTLYRIIALKSFGEVKEGDLGGFIEGEWNLSDKGNCWVANNAKVYGNASIYENAMVFGDALIFGNAWVIKNAQVYENAQVYGDARVYGNAQVYGDARVSGDAWVSRNAQVFGNARVYEYAQVFGNAHVYEYAQVFGNAWVFGKAQVCGDARVFGDAKICYEILTCDTFKNIQQYIACSLNIYPVKGWYYLYKRVNKISEGKYSSLYDKNFIYEDNKISKVKNPEMDKSISCGGGLHVSTPFYCSDGDTLISVKVKVSDVITCQEGKLRCKAVTVIGEVKNV